MENLVSQMTVFTLIFVGFILLMMLTTKLLLAMTIVGVVYTIYLLYSSRTWDGRKYRPKEFLPKGTFDPQLKAQVREFFGRLEAVLNRLDADGLQELATGEALAALRRAIHARKSENWCRPFAVELKQVFMISQGPPRIHVRVAGRRRFPDPNAPLLTGPPWQSFGEDWWLEPDDSNPAQPFKLAVRERLA